MTIKDTAGAAAFPAKARARLFADPKLNMPAAVRALRLFGQTLMFIYIGLMVWTPLALDSFTFAVGVVIYGVGYVLLMLALHAFKHAPCDQVVAGGPYRLSRNPQLIQPLELRLKRKKSPPKICLSDWSMVWVAATQDAPKLRAEDRGAKAQQPGQEHTAQPEFESVQREHQQVVCATARRMANRQQPRPADGTQEPAGDDAREA